jgi:hypothetical protein
MRSSGAREHRHELALPARGRALPAGQLHRMRRVEHDGQPVSRMIASERMSETRLL